MSNIASFARIGGQVRTREHVELTDLDEFNRLLAARAHNRAERMMSALRGDMDVQERSIRAQLQAFGLPETTEGKTTLTRPVVIPVEYTCQNWKRIKAHRGRFNLERQLRSDKPGVP